MSADIETILQAFAGTWKPGIEEQSIRTAHTLALAGDKGTASNILKFIAIPEPMKMQILGGALTNFAANQPFIQPGPGVVVSEVGSTHTQEKPMTMPEPLSQDMAASARTVSAEDVANAVLVTETSQVAMPAFGKDLTIQQIYATGSAPSAAIDQVAVASRAAPAGITVIGPTTKLSDPLLVPSSNASASMTQSYDRAKELEKMFENVRKKTGDTTSKPMVKDADNISVIHTYAQPEPSKRAEQADLDKKVEAGVKLFEALRKMIDKGVTSNDEDVINAARIQWDRFNAEYPTYQTFHALEWREMQKKLDGFNTSRAQSESSTVVDNLSNESISNESSPSISITSVPINTSSGFFARKTQVTGGASSTAHGQAEILPEVHEVTLRPVSANPLLNKSEETSEQSRFFAHKQISGSSNNTLQQSSTKTLAEELEEIRLGALSVRRNMTITGASIYRVSHIVREGDQTSIVFTDEIKDFRVPAHDLEMALSDSSTQPDDFFAKYARV